MGFPHGYNMNKTGYNVYPPESKQEHNYNTLSPVKHDDGKPRWELLPLNVIEEVVKVLTDGAKEYSDNNWKGVASCRYFAATMRHKTAYQAGEVRDPKSGHYHLAHEICSLVFQLWFQMQGDKNAAV